MFKNHIIFKILYIIVGPLRPASLKRLVFFSDRPADSALWLAEHHASEMLSIIASFSFQNKCKDRLKMSLVLLSVQARKWNSRVTDTEIKLVCVVCSTQAAVKTADSTVMWPCLSLSLSLTLSLTLTLTHSTHYSTLRCDVTMSLSLSLSHTLNALLYTVLWCDHVSLPLSHTQRITLHCAVMWPCLSHTHDTQNSAFEQSTISL